MRPRRPSPRLLAVLDAIAARKGQRTRAKDIAADLNYFADIQRRIKLLSAGPDERARESIKASGKVQDAGPLFQEIA